MTGVALGLAVVLMAIGMPALYARRLLPGSQKTARSVAFRYIPVASAALIAGIGAVMTGVALGVVRVAAG